VRPFFEPRHDELAERLALLNLGDGDDRALGESLGQLHDLYKYLLPDSGKIDVRSLCVIREWLGYVSPLADAIFAVQGLGSYPILLAGSGEQENRWLPDLRAGKRIAGFALTEPEAGSDVASMQMTATPDSDGGYLLRGEKTLISNVGIADQYVVFAKTPGADVKPHRRISAFVVESDADGLTEKPMVMGFEHPIGGLVFDDCRVGPEALLGKLGGGFRLAMQTLDTFRVSVGAAAVGMARRALSEALQHVRRRKQFGAYLGEHQMVQGYLADMATELDAAKLLVLRAAYEKDQGAERVTTEAAMAKLYATEAAQRIIDKAVQLLGGRGVVAGEVVETLYRAIRPLRIYEGTSEIQRLIIGRALVGG